MAESSIIPSLMFLPNFSQNSMYLRGNQILRRVHAIDATLARWRGDIGSSPLDRARTAASSPIAPNTLVDFHTGRRQLGRPRRDPQGHVRGGGVKSSCPYLSFVLLLCPHPSFVLLLFRTVAPPTPRAASDVCPLLSNSSVQVASLFRTVY